MTEARFLPAERLYRTMIATKGHVTEPIRTRNARSLDDGTEPSIFPFAVLSLKWDLFLADRTFLLPDMPARL